MMITEISILRTLLTIAGITLVVGINAVFVVWLERKVAGHMQFRLGPTEVGPFGLLQTVADGLKLLSKQIIFPSSADTPIFILAPIICLIPVFVALVPVPFSKTLQAHELDIGLLLVIALGLLNTLGILLAGWGCDNKYALLGASRAVAQILAYKIPLLLCILPVILLAGTFSLREIVVAQQESMWFAFYQPVAFFMYLIAITMETNRSPFDFAEAESELVAGFHTEYSGMMFSLFFLAEYTYMFLASAIASILFLGGWLGPILPGPIWMLLKIYFFLFLMMWFRWTFPRVRVDQMLTFGWKILLPISLLNFLITAGVMAVL
ncbi:MAG: NADH-quinone oxidoreductase subunit NuoH [Desulfobulbaceae bacterium]|nr:NADH-quinone oxidoreductase subunit NuoH [Desulfobulbaceae bacterium]